MKSIILISTIILFFFVNCTPTKDPAGQNPQMTAAEAEDFLSQEFRSSEGSGTFKLDFKAHAADYSVSRVWAHRYCTGGYYCNTWETTADCSWTSSETSLTKNDDVFELRARPVGYGSYINLSMNNCTKDGSVVLYRLKVLDRNCFELLFEKESLKFCR